MNKKQQQVLEALQDGSSQREAAKKLGISQSTVCHHLKQATLDKLKRATLENLPPALEKSRSTLYDGEGNIKQQWVKVIPTVDTLDLIKEFKRELPRAKKVKPPKKGEGQLLNLHVLTDLHLGMYAWGEECGENWDIYRAEACLNKAASRLVWDSPAADTAMLAQLGDALHSDGHLPVTPENKNILDQDTRYQKLVRISIRAFRRYISLLLERHRKVIFLAAAGNHDLSSACWLQEAFEVFYQDEPRVEVIKSPLPYYAVQHGKVLLGFHHGHKHSSAKPLAEIFSSQFRKMHGETDVSYVHIGHIHRKALEQRDGTIVEQHQTLAARDAYAAHLGYHPGRSMQVITYDHEGEVSRTIHRA